jgi:hypothetical protein
VSRTGRVPRRGGGRAVWSPHRPRSPPTRLRGVGGAPPPSVPCPRAGREPAGPLVQRLARPAGVTTRSDGAGRAGERGVDQTGISDERPGTTIAALRMVCTSIRTSPVRRHHLTRLARERRAATGPEAAPCRPRPTVGCRVADTTLSGMGSRAAPGPGPGPRPTVSCRAERARQAEPAPRKAGSPSPREMAARTPRSTAQRDGAPGVVRFGPRRRAHARLAGRGTASPGVVTPLGPILAGCPWSSDCARRSLRPCHHDHLWRPLRSKSGHPVPATGTPRAPALLSSVRPPASGTSGSHPRQAVSSAVQRRGTRDLAAVTDDVVPPRGPGPGPRVQRWA